MLSYFCKTQSMLVCKFFPSKSGCARGDQCSFQHVQLANQEQLDSAISPPNLMPSCRATDSIPTGLAKTPLSSFPDPFAEVGCRYFKKGACKNGDRCRFRHNTTSEEEIAHESIPQQARNDHSEQKSG